MRMEEGLDTGPVYLERRVRIGERETAGELSSRLASIGGELLVETLRGTAGGPLSARAAGRGGLRSAGRSGARTAPRTGPLRGRELSRRLRAYTPWPGLYTFLGAERIKILDAECVPEGSREAAGNVAALDRAAVVVAGEGTPAAAARAARREEAGLGRGVPPGPAASGPAAGEAGRQARPRHSLQGLHSRVSPLGIVML